MTNVVPEDARIAELTRELENLRGRHAAVADVLRALSRSGLRLQPILDQIVETASPLCRADSCMLHLADGDVLRIQASVGLRPGVAEYERAHPDRPGPHSCAGRVAMTKRPVHIPDIHADPDYTWPEGGFLTLLGLPVLFEDQLVGVIEVARHKVQPFDDTEIDLMATFADQSAIAIANAKLFETVERQKGELARFVSPAVAPGLL